MYLAADILGSELLRLNYLQLRGLLLRPLEGTYVTHPRICRGIMSLADSERKGWSEFE